MDGLKTKNYGTQDTKYEYASSNRYTGLVMRNFAHQHGTIAPSQRFWAASVRKLMPLLLQGHWVKIRQCSALLNIDNGTIFTRGSAVDISVPQKTWVAKNSSSPLCGYPHILLHMPFGGRRGGVFMFPCHSCWKDWLERLREDGACSSRRGGKSFRNLVVQIAVASRSLKRT